MKRSGFNLKPPLERRSSIWISDLNRSECTHKMGGTPT
jgi:hypothetical protein